MANIEDAECEICDRTVSKENEYVLEYTISHRKCHIEWRRCEDAGLCGYCGKNLGDECGVHKQCDDDNDVSRYWSL